MKILIIEDEQPAAKRLASMLQKQSPEAIIVGTLDSIESSIKWLQQFKHPDLIFMDIHLADGLSFEILNQVELLTPVIFSTAYDQYTLQAFKANSIDYLLKPIIATELAAAITKFEKLHTAEQQIDYKSVAALLQQKTYKQNFLVKRGNQFKQIAVTNINHFYSTEGFTYLVTHTKDSYLIDDSLEQVKQLLDPTLFFRINRGSIISMNAIQKISTYFNNRLKLELTIKTKQENVVSREKVSDFKKWLDQ